MSAPPLPEVFGNYVLGTDFVEVVSPEGVSWLPQTPGWYVLGALLLGLLSYHTWRRLRHWYRNRYRREAEAQLQQLAANDADTNWLTELNRLLKRTALAGFSRTQVARLSGNSWVEFLNAQCSPPPFSAEQGRALAEGVYSAAPMEPSARQALLESCRRWIEQHEGPQDV